LTLAGAVATGWAGEAAHEVDAPVAIEPADGALPVGERLIFHGRFFGIPVGSGSIEIRGLTTLEGRPAYEIYAEGRSNVFLSSFYPIHDVVQSYLDPDTLQPIRFEKDQREGHYRAHEVVTFDHGRGVATYRSLLNQSTKEVPLTAGAHDIISAFYWLRRQPIEIGRPIHVDIYSDEKVYRTEVVPLKTLMLELLRVGNIPAIAVEPKPVFKGILVQRGRIVAYVSADRRRIPLLVKLWTPWGLITGVIDRASLEQKAVPSGAAP
jgi:hypothetical protein